MEWALGSVQDLMNAYFDNIIPLAATRYIFRKLMLGASALHRWGGWGSPEPPGGSGGRRPGVRGRTGAQWLASDSRSRGMARSFSDLLGVWLSKDAFVRPISSPLTRQIPIEKKVISNNSRPHPHR